MAPKKKAKKKKKMPDSPIRPKVGNVKGAGPLNSQKLGGISFMTKKPGNNAYDGKIQSGLLKIM